MKISHIETLIQRGSFSQSQEWQIIRQQALDAIQCVDWPVGSGKFTVYPESGKKRGQGNGVKPIKNAAISYLKNQGWLREYPLPINTQIRPGKIDAAYLSNQGIVGFEWETGNISSSHRSMNKMALGLLSQAMIAGLLVIPSRQLYRYLTDRIGNYSELEPYFPLWKSIPCKEGILEVIMIEHDDLSFDVPRIPKGTDGRAIL
ncbi:MAG: restriction endonuclease [Microcoleaceae cyanobacterium]